MKAWALKITILKHVSIDLRIKWFWVATLEKLPKGGKIHAKH